MEPYYDTPEGIQESLKSVGSLHQLLEDRRKAYYNQEEFLTNWIVNGFWYLDSCGNALTAMDEYDYTALCLQYPDIPAVIQYDDFGSWLATNYPVSNEEERPFLRWRGSGGLVPPPRIFCPECEKRWTVPTLALNVVLTSKHEELDANEWVGMSLYDVNAILETRMDAEYQIDQHTPFRNDGYIDLSPHPKYEGVVVNEKGWQRSKEDNITFDYIIKPGDILLVNVWRYYHKSCHELYKERTLRDAFEKTFKDAGFEEFCLEKIPNEYCQCEVCGPWFLMSTRNGSHKLSIKIGWRKRVIHVGWEAMHKDLSHLFKGEDTTLEKSCVHAWGYEKATDYVGRIMDYYRTES